MFKATLLSLVLLAAAAFQAHAFAPSPSFGLASTQQPPKKQAGALAMSDSTDDFLVDSTQERIAAMVEKHPVLLFMKGSKLFPQCGFSNTACQILQSYNIDFETVDVLAGWFFC